MRFMHIAIRVEGTFPERGAVISNHMGYLDIMSFAATHPAVFVSAAELGKLPVLGWMITVGGTVYVERGRGGSAARAGVDLRAAAEEGVPVIFFPEGTTSSGHTVIPFHSGILAQVLNTEEPITPAFVRYRLTQDNGPRVTLENDLAYWGDDVQLFPHIFHLLGVRGIEVTLRFADAPIAFSAAGRSNRKLAAAEARAAVMELGGLRDTVPAG